MIDKILQLRQKLRELYARYEEFITPILKIVVMLVVLILLNSSIGYSESMTSWNIVALAVLISALLPWSAMTGIVAIFTLINLGGLSIEVAAVAAALMIVAAVMQYVFLPRFGLAIALLPIAYMLHIPYIFPLALGALGTMTSFIPAGVGAFFYFFVQGVEKNADFFMRTSGQGADILERLSQIFIIITSSELILNVIAFTLTTLVVYFVKKLTSDYSQYIAIAVGAIVNIIIFLVGGFTTNITLPYIEIFAGSIGGFLIASAAVLWMTSADYNHTEHLQYEDDDYVYYVKAIPKIKLAAKELRVHDITPSDKDKEEQG